MRTGILLSGFVLWSFVPVAQDAKADAILATQVRLMATQNFIDFIKLPPDQQTPIVKEVVTKLAASVVPRAEDAWRLALAALDDGPGHPSSDGLTVTGLVRIGANGGVPGLGSTGDLVWEVRANRGSPGEIVRVLWVSTTTKAVRELVPTLLARGSI
jgi:hypothetical protein